MTELSDGYWEQQEDDSCSMLRKQGTPASASGEAQLRQRRSLWRAIGVFFGMCRDYTADDFARLKEAGVQKAEHHAAHEQAKAKREDAEAEKILAEAAEIHERIDESKRKDALRVMEYRKDQLTKQAEIEVARAKRADSEARRAQAMADAMERVSDAISTIRSKGGNVAFDSDQLMRLLQQGIAENPEDASLQETLENLLEPADGDDSRENE